MISSKRVDELLVFLLDRGRFKQLITLQSSAEIENAYVHIVGVIINKINAILFLGRHELQVVSGHYYVIASDKKAIVDAQKVKLINRALYYRIRGTMSGRFCSW
jgi:hypothetical protein